MNIEELSTVAEIITSLGETAGNSFYAYLGLMAFKSIWSGVVFLAVVIMAYKASTFIRIELEATMAIKQLRSELGVGSSGVLTSREIRMVKIKVIELNKINNQGE